MFKKIKRKIKNLQNNIKRYKYARYYRKLDIVKDTVLFEASQGRNAEGHIFYLIKEMQRLYPNKKIYVSAKQPDTMRAYFAHNGINNIKVILFESVAYAKCLATVEMLINDTSFYPFFTKKEGQKYIIVWHGTPLKYMGKDVPDITSVANVQRNFYQADEIHVSNTYTRDIFLRAYNLDKIYTGKVVVAPSPRNSILLAGNATKVGGKTRVLYMPTWRGIVGRVKEAAKVQEDLAYLAANLPDSVEFYVRMHPFQRTENTADLPGIHYIDAHEEIYAFLQSVDVLVTDYSSIMYDFVNREKPIILYTFDKEEYTEERGVYEDIDTYPFTEVATIEELVDAIQHAPEVASYPTMQERFTAHDAIDGAKIALEYMVDGKEHAAIDVYKPHNGKETVVLFSGGFWNNGITSSLINLLEKIDVTEKNYVCIFNKNAVKKASFDRVRNLPEGVQFYPMTGAINGTLFERMVLKKYLWKENFDFK